MPKEAIDVKTTDASSSSATDASSQNADVSGASSASTSTSSQVVKANESIDDVIQRTIDANGKIDKADSEVDDTTPEDEEELDSKIESDKEEEKEVNEEEEAPVDEDKEKLADGTEVGKPVPYERFKTVAEERDQWKEKFETIREPLQSYSNIVKMCQDSNISPEDFNKALEIQGLISSGQIDKALEKLTPIYQALKGYTGDLLPTDLQRKVDEGKLEIEDAKELAQLRAKTQMGQKTLERTQEQIRQEKVQQFEGQLRSSVSDWVTRKQKMDPDFKQKAKEDAVDGKWELVNDKYNVFLQAVDSNGASRYPIKSPADAIALLEKAYFAINATYQQIGGRKPATRNRLPSNGSSNGVGNKDIAKAKTIEEAVELQLANSGVRM